LEDKLFISQKGTLDVLGGMTVVLGGYMGNVLEVDLTEKKLTSKKIGEKTLRKYIGGVGLAAKILWEETTADTEPFSPQNILIFMTGPLTDTNMPLSGRHIIAGISPLTNIWGQAHSGGAWGDELKHAGFDGVVIKGKSDNPVYLWLCDGKAEIRDANHLWGLDTYQTDTLLKKETDEKASVAAIGPAGEKLVRIACIMNDGKKGRAAARCGLGAVMGYKMLKAIAVRGTLKIHVCDEENFSRNVKKIYEISPVKKREEYLEEYIGTFKKQMDAGGHPIKNWSKGSFPPRYEIPEETRNTKPQYCRHCPYSCAESRLTENGERHMVMEHWAPMGTNCLISDCEALQKAFSLCQRYGLDSISTGEVIAFAMELMEKGLITKEETGGIDLRWGNHEAMVEMVKKIGEKEGFGAVLGEGVKRIAEHIGGTASEYALHVKGLSFPAHDPRATFGRALNYATSNLGASHYEGGAYACYIENYLESDLINLASPDLGYPVRLKRFEVKGKGELVAKCQNWACVVDSLVVCAFLMLLQYIQPSHHAELLKSVTGWDVSLQELLKTGERIFNLKRAFNVRRGISRKDDTLPPRFLTHMLKEGGAAGRLPFLGLMLNEYYMYRGWSEEGFPTEEKLKELDLDFVTARS